MIGNLVSSVKKNDNEHNENVLHEIEDDFNKKVAFGVIDLGPFFAIL